MPEARIRESSLLNNPTLIGAAQQILAARQMRQKGEGENESENDEAQTFNQGMAAARMGRSAAGRGKTDQGNYFDELTQTYYNLNELFDANNRVGATVNAIKLGLRIRKAISDGKFEGGNFYTVLILSVLKDFIDIASFGIYGTLFNIPIIIFLFIVFFLQLSTIKKFILKRYIWPSIVEYIPFINTFPSYTISTLWLKVKVDRRNKEMEANLREIEKKFNLLKNPKYAKSL